MRRSRKSSLWAKTTTQGISSLGRESFTMMHKHEPERSAAVECLHGDNPDMRQTTINRDFRCYMHAGTTAFSFELAGSLSDDSVRELQCTRRTASSAIGDRSLIVDLSYVTGIDGAAQELLREWHDRGAQLVAKSPESRALVQSITGESLAQIPAAARHSTWLPFQRIALSA
jgi:hypothetical protein